MTLKVILSPPFSVGKMCAASLENLMNYWLCIHIGYTLQTYVIKLVLGDIYFCYTVLLDFTH